MSKKKPLTEDQLKRKANQIKGATYQNNLKRKPTKYELIFRRALMKENIKFQFQKLYYSTERIYILDFYLKTLSGRYCIEIDGGYHTTEWKKKYDSRRDNWILEKRRTVTIRFTNTQIETSLDECVKRVLSLSPKITNKKQNPGCGISYVPKITPEVEKYLKK